MDLKRMLYFCTIVEQGQISRAADVLHMAQPPLSQRLKELEEELGCELFLRKGRMLQITEAGRAFYKRARGILREVESARDEVIRVSSQVGPSLRFGLSPTCRNFWLARFEALRANLQGRTLGVVVGDSSYLEYLLQTGQLDAALMQPPVHPESFRIHSVATCTTVAVAPVEMFGAQTTALSLADLWRHPLLLLRRSVGVGSYERLLQAFHEAKMEPRVALYSSDVKLLLDLLEGGFSGVAVVPATEVASVSPRCKVIPLLLDLPEYNLSVVSKAVDNDDDTLSRVLMALQA